MKNIIKNQNGFTLIEVTVSLLLLGIISTFIFPLIGSSVTKIIKSGNYDQAINTTSNFTELIHQEVISKGKLNEEQWENLSNNIYYKGDSVDIEYKNSFNFNSKSKNNKILFSKKQTNGGYKLKVIFFFNNGKKQIRFDSFVSHKRG